MDDTLSDAFFGNWLVTEFFMAETALALAMRQPEPREWAKSFITRLHQRIDQSEDGAPDHPYPIHQHARAQIRTVERELMKVVGEWPDIRSRYDV